MSKFNKTKTPIVPTEVNDMGELAYKATDREELVSTCLTSFLSKSYYESENEIVTRIKNAAKKVDTDFLAKFALYLRTEANMRSASHLLAGELASRLSGKEYAKRFYKKIAVRPDDMSEILAYYFSLGSFKLPNAMKDGFARKIESMDAYLMDKYKMKNKEISLIDIVRLTHPKATDKNRIALEKLVKGESLVGLYESKILEKEMSNIVATEDKTVEELKGEAISSVINNVKGMPMMNMVRNLRNIILYAPNEIDEVITQLTTKEKVLNSRLLPFRFVSAYNEVSKMEVPKGIKFEKDGNIVNKVLSALEVALEYSVLNIPKLVGNTAILIDHSGSVRGDGGEDSLVSTFSKVSTAMIGNLFGTMLAYSQDNVYIGLFGDRLINVPINRSEGVLKSNKQSFQLGSGCGGNTENGLYYFLNDCIQNKTSVNNLVIFSDMVIGDGGKGGWDGSSRAGLGTFQELFKKFKQVNPMCNTISVNIRDTKGTSVFDKSLNVTQVSGWSEKIFDIIDSRCKGYDALMKEIEAIQL